MSVRITSEVFETLPSSLKAELRRSVPVEVVVLGRDAEDAKRRVRALGYLGLAERLDEVLGTLRKRLAVGR